MAALKSHSVWAVLFICTLLLGCSATEEVAQSERIVRARAFLRAEDYYHALSLLNEIIPEADKTTEYHLMQGMSFFKLEDFQQAVVALERAHPTSVKLQTYIAYLHLLLGNAERARTLADALERRYGPKPEILILKGNISLKEQIYPEAEEHFHSTLLRDKASIKAYIGLANTYLAERRFVKAEENYLKALFLSNNDISPYIALMHYYIAVKRHEDAVQTANMALKRYPDHIDILMTVSNLYTKLQKSAEAIVTLNRALELYPLSNYIKIRMIHNYFDLNMLEDAYRLIRDLLSRNAEDYYILTLLGEYHLRKKDFEVALSFFERALLKNKNSYTANYYVGLIHLIRKKIRLSIQFLETSIYNYPNFTKSHLLLGIAYIYMRKYSLASDHAKLVQNLDPGNISAHLINGISLFFRMRLKESKYEFEVVEVLDPQNPIVHIMKTLIALELGTLDDAKSHLSNIEREHVEKLFLEIELFKLMGFSKKEIENQLELYTYNEHDYLTLILLGNFYKEHMDFSMAEKYFKKAVAVNENTPIPYYHLAELELAKGNMLGAIVYLHRVIDINPHFVKAYQALGSLYEREKDYHSAKMVYEKGLGYTPEDSLLLNNLGWLKLVHFGDGASAYLDIRKARSLAPDDLDIQDTLAWWYYLNNDYQQSIMLLKKIVETDPDNAIYRYHLGMAYMGAGAKGEGALNLKKALELGIDDEYQRIIRQTIR
jgi:tetratricopeptide (TPR) repeat protein